VTHALAKFGGIQIGAIVERVREVSSVSGDPAAGRQALEAVITASAQIKAWLAAADARLAQAPAAQVSFPEQAIADCTRESLCDVAKTKERADTLDKVPGFADAPGEAAVTPAHVDAITSKAKPLADDQRAEYFDRVAGLVDIACRPPSTSSNAA
jgi:hypothetical protein